MAFEFGSEITKPEPPPKSSEDVFYELIETLDAPTRKTPGFIRIVAEAEDSGDFHVAINKLKQLKLKRNAALDRVNVQFAEGRLNYNPRGIEEIVAEVRLAVSYPERFLGNGAVCDVFTLRRSMEDPADVMTCVKVVRDYEKYAEGNTLIKEMEMLDILHDLDVAGVHAPKPLFTFSSIRLDGLAMEHLDAVNFRRVIERQTTEGVRDQLPETFQVDHYFANLRGYVKAMHERGVVHKDLHLRNLMIDRTTGNPYVIDFGKAIVDRDLDKTRTSFDDVKKQDLATLDSAEVEARKWLVGGS